MGVQTSGEVYICCQGCGGMLCGLLCADTILMATETNQNKIITLVYKVYYRNQYRPVYTALVQTLPTTIPGN